MKILAVLALLGVSSVATAMTKQEQRCLALAVYSESRGETVAGWKAVTDVITNRSKSGLFPKNLCNVIYQRSQFTNIRHTRIKDHVVYTKILRMVESYHWVGSSRGALWYHARRVRPHWSKHMVRVAVVGHHVFYRRRLET